MKTVKGRSDRPCFNLCQIRRQISLILKGQPEWRREFRLLFDRVDDDCRMALVRARSLLEWLITEKCLVSIGPGATKGDLHRRIVGGGVKVVENRRFEIP
jgi:hypothetical protein